MRTALFILLGEEGRRRATSIQKISISLEAISKLFKIVKASSLRSDKGSVFPPSHKAAAGQAPVTFPPPHKATAGQAR